MWGDVFQDGSLFLLSGFFADIGFVFCLDVFTGSPVAAFSTSPPFSLAISASNRLLRTERGSSATMSFCEEYLSRCLINNQDLSALLPKPRVRTSTQEPRSFLPSRLNFK